MTDNKEEAKAWEEPAETDGAHLKVMEFLKAAGITPTVTEHKAVLTCEEAAEVRGVDLASGAKAMLIKDGGKKLARDNVPYYLAIISAANKFNSKRFCKVLGTKSVSFAKPEVVHELTGCLTGAVPPFG
jgi:Ala-tRNA(Pro) deacylase